MCISNSKITTLSVLLVLGLCSVSMVHAQESSSASSTNKEKPRKSSREETIIIKADGAKGGEIKVTINQDGKVETRVFKVDKDTPMEEVHDVIIKEMKLNSPPKTFPFLQNEEHEFTLTPPTSNKFQKQETKTALLPFLGIAVTETPDDISKYLPIPRSSGITVRSIAEKSPATKTTLTVDDLIYQVDDQIIFNPDQFASLIRSYEKDQKVTIQYLRKGEKLTTEATLELKEMAIAQTKSPTDPKFWIHNGSVPPPLMHLPGNQIFTVITDPAVAPEGFSVQSGFIQVGENSELLKFEDLDIDEQIQIERMELSEPIFLDIESDDVIPLKDEPSKPIPADEDPV